MYLYMNKNNIDPEGTITRRAQYREKNMSGKTHSIKISMQFTLMSGGEFLRNRPVSKCIRLLAELSLMLTKYVSLNY